MQNNFKLLILPFSVNLIFQVLIWPIFIANPFYDNIEAAYLGMGFELGYYKHPPLVNWVIKFFNLIFDNSLFTYRLVPQLYLIIVFIFIYKLACEFTTKNNAILAILFLMLCSSSFSIKSNLFQHDVIIILPFIASLYFYYKFLQKNTYKYALLFGIFIALGMLGKYFFAIPMLAFIFHSLFIAKQYKNLKLYLTGFITILLLFPHIYWLFENNFKPFEYAKNTLEVNNLYSFYYLPLYIAFQLLIFITIFGVILREKPNWQKIKKAFLKPNFIQSFTFLIIIILCLVMFFVKFKGPSRFIIFFIPILPIFAILLFKAKIKTKALNKVCFIVTFILIVIYCVKLYESSHKDKLENQDFKTFVNTLQEKWQEKCGNKPIKFLYTPNGYFLGAVWLYLNPKPVFVPYDFKNVSKNLSYENLRKEGGVIIYNEFNNSFHKTNDNQIVLTVENYKSPFVNKHFTHEFLVEFVCGTSSLTPKSN